MNYVVLAPPRLIPSAIDKTIDMAVCILVFSDRLFTLSTPVYLLLKVRGFAKQNPRNGHFNQTQYYMG